jgi:hypothetical protein
MLAIFAIVAPVFALIAIGYLAGRTGLISESAGAGVAEFAFSLAIPALLFRTIVKADFAGLSPAAVLASFFGAAALTWILAALATHWPLGRPAEDGASIAMASVFGNTALLGLPLAISTYGSAAEPAIALILSVHAPMLWLAATIHAEAVGEGSGRPSLVSLLGALVSELARNPIVIGIALGIVWRIGGIALPSVADKVLSLLAQAGVPAALTALGLTLVKFEIKGQAATLATITLLKLALMPMLAWLLAGKVFGLSGATLGVIAIMAAMPTGANAFLFASRRGRAVNSASGAVALGTILTFATAAVVIALVGR